MNKAELAAMIAAQVKQAFDDHVDPLKAEHAAEREERTIRMHAMLAREAGAMVTPAESKDLVKANAGMFFRALAAGAGDAGKAADFAKAWGAGDTMCKALGESTIAGGGALVPDSFADTVIELLYARTVVRKMGAVPIPMPNGNLTMARVASGSSAAYTGENQVIASSQQTFEQLKMSAKKLGVIVPTSNELLRDSSPRADAIILNDMVRQAAVREDLAFIRGDGFQDTPIGIRNLSNIQTTATTGTSQAQIAADLANAILSLEENNVPMTKVGWLMSPRSKSSLTRLLDGNGNRVYAQEMAGGTLEGFPFASTTSIPINLGGGAESELYLADFEELLIGEVPQDNMTVEVFPGGTYNDGGTLRSGISRDQTVLRLVMSHDFAGRQSGLEAHITTALAW